MKNLYLCRSIRGRYYISRRGGKVIVETIKCYEIPEKGREIGSSLTSSLEKPLDMIIKITNETLRTFKRDSFDSKINDYTSRKSVEELVDARLNAWGIKFISA